MSLLDEFVEGIILLDKDREHLRDVRGFDDETIDKYRFRSCQPDNARKLASMLEVHGMGNMISTHLYHTGAYGKPAMEQQLLEENILIPYINADGTLLKIRPHCMGFKGEGADIYRTESSFKRSTSCVIAESEFKAVAAECFGFAAIGIPGISTMSGKLWDHFLGTIRGINTDGFVICFDNEVKDDPAFKSFKTDWKKRYDTVVYAYVMCQKILDAGLQCRVATLPKQWMHEGKVDIDSALSDYRRTKDEGYKLKFQHTILNAIHPKEYLKTVEIPEEHKHYTTRLMKSFFVESPIVVKNNCFYTRVIKKNPEEATELRKVTNCTIYVKNVYEQMGDDEVGGVKRDLAIIDEYGIEFPAAPIMATSMASKNGFSTWLMGQGNFLFFGKDEDVTALWEYVFAHDTSDVVYMMDRCGYIKELDGYMFRNCFITGGKVAEADNTGILWLENVGYKPTSLNLSNENTLDIPSLIHNDLFDIHKYVELMSNTVDINAVGQGKAMVSWMLALPFIEKIHAKFRCFPLMFIYGSRGSGKTTIMRWLGQLLGISTIYSLAMTSAVGIVRVLGYYSGLPVIIDDWRDDDKCLRLVTTLLGVYNRQMGAKGVRTKFGVTQSVIRGAPILGGEELISDNALATRCVSFYIPHQRVKQSLDEMDEMSAHASTFMLDVYRTMGENAPKVMQGIDRSVKMLRAASGPQVENRIVFNHAICLGAYETLLGEDQELRTYFIEKTKHAQIELTEGDKIHRFAQEFSFGTSQNIISSKMFKYDAKAKVVTLYLAGITAVMDKYHCRSATGWKIIAKHMSQQIYFGGAVNASYPGVAGQLPSVNLRVDLMPPSIRTHFSGLENRNAYP